MNSFEWIRVYVFQVSQVEFARILECSQPMVSRWEIGSTRPRLEHLEHIRLAAMERGLPWDDRWLFEPPTDALPERQRKGRHRENMAASL